MRKLFEDLYYDGSLILQEGSSAKRPGVLSVIEGPFGITETKNKNGRIYRNSLWERILKEKGQDLKERAIVGEPEHPNTLYPRLERVSHVVTDLKLLPEKKTVWGRAEILDTPTGRVLDTLFKAGVKVGISSRGAGSTVDEGGDSYVNEDDYIFAGFDFVSNPSAPNAYPGLAESLMEAVSPCLDKMVQEEKDRDYYGSLLSKFGVSINTLVEKAHENSPLLVEKTEPKAKDSDAELGRLKTENQALLEQVKKMLLKLPEEEVTPLPNFDDFSPFDATYELQQKMDEMSILASSYRKERDTLKLQMETLKNTNFVLESRVESERKALQENHSATVTKNQTLLTEKYNGMLAERAQQVQTLNEEVKDLQSRLDEEVATTKDLYEKLDDLDRQRSAVEAEFQGFCESLLEQASVLFSVSDSALREAVRDELSPAKILECILSLSPKLSDPSLPLARVRTKDVTVQLLSGPDPSDTRPRPGTGFRKLVSSNL